LCIRYRNSIQSFRLKLVINTIQIKDKISEEELERTALEEAIRISIEEEADEMRRQKGADDAMRDEDLQLFKTAELEAARLLKEHTIALNEVLSYNQGLRDQLAAKKAAKLAAKDAKKRPIDNSVDLISTELKVEDVTVSDEVKELKEQMAAIQKLITQKSRTTHSNVSVKTPVSTFVKVEKIAVMTPVAPPRDGQVLVKSPVGRLFDKVGPQGNVPPVASVLKKKNKNTDSGAPKPSETECIFIEDYFIIDEEKVVTKDITFISKTSGQQELLKTCSPQLINHRGESYAWQNAGKNAGLVQTWAE
jgi:hypothetical protein